MERLGDMVFCNVWLGSEVGNGTRNFFNAHERPRGQFKPLCCVSEQRRRIRIHNAVLVDLLCGHSGICASRAVVARMLSLKRFLCSLPDAC